MNGINKTKTTENYNSRFQEFSGVKALVMGLGLNGGGLESARYLALRGAELCITDLRDENTLKPSIEELEKSLDGQGSKIRYVLGRHEISDFEKAGLIVKNPGVRPDSPFLKAANLKGNRIETDISLFLYSRESENLRLTAVTGSKGKSSISSALHHVLKTWHKNSGGGDSFLGGNITVSPLSFLKILEEEKNQKELRGDLVLELSSWQLGDLKGKFKSDGRFILKPAAAVISAIMPDHLDHYGNMENYVNDKRIIYYGQDKNDCTVAGDDSWGLSFLKETKARPIVYPLNESDTVFEMLPEKLIVPGRHQRTNMIAAGLALLDLGLPSDFIKENLASFPGIENRLEFFFQKDGIEFFNDSASTIPESAAAAIRAFGTDSWPILICGGTDKELDFSPLADAAKEASAIVLFAGTGTEKLIPLLNNKNIPYKGPFDSLEKVLKAAFELASASGGRKKIVFSPGCTSFGSFLNEFDRGKKWKETVKSFF